jgi:hypothetical protein
MPPKMAVPSLSVRVAGLNPPRGFVLECSTDPRSAGRLMFVVVAVEMSRSPPK